jgi:hypothetical protein
MSHLQAEKLREKFIFSVFCTFRMNPPQRRCYMKHENKRINGHIYKKKKSKSSSKTKNSLKNFPREL